MVKIILAIVFVLFIGLQFGQEYIKKIIDNASFQVAPAHVLPASIGLDYKEISIENEGRKTRAWFTEVPKEKNCNTSVILFNGIGANLSGWIYFQKFLADSGIASVSFDYGPQKDTTLERGTSRLEDVTKDVATIIDSLKRQYGKSLKLFLLGHSVGNAVMLEMYPMLDTASIKAVIICNAFSSITNWGIQHHEIPKIFSFLFPDYFDNVDNIKEVYKPVIILHSKADSVNLFSDGEEIFKSANPDKKFVKFDGYPHNGIYKQENFSYWLPIVEFIKAHSY